MAHLNDLLKMKIVKVTPENVLEEGIFCIKNAKSPGFEKKLEWFRKRYQEGLILKLVKDDQDVTAGFIEYVPAEYAWRPVMAPNYYFIHCMMIYPNKYKHQGYGAALLQDCIDDARRHHKDGVAVMTSQGPWMADSQLFTQNGFQLVEGKDRFELLAWSVRNESRPRFYHWENRIKHFKGWHLLYSDQCPWHHNSAEALAKVAQDHDLNLQVEKIGSAQDAQKVPCGYGTFSLIHDGKLVADHYLSETRFKNILKQEQMA